MEALTLIVPAFIAGLLTFLAPCTLPLVPGFLAFISGTEVRDVNGLSPAHQARWKIFRNALYYVVGFSMVFIGFGVLAGAIFEAPALLGAGAETITSFRRILARLGGVLVIFFGLFLLFDLSRFRWFQPLQGEYRFHPKHALHPGEPGSSFLFGATFAFGWSPCVGPILGSILLLTSTTGSIIQGALLLAVFSIGLALPFLIVAAIAGSATVWVRGMSRYLPRVSKIGGAFLIAIGALMVFNLSGIWSSWIVGVLDVIGYDRLIDHL